MLNIFTESGSQLPGSRQKNSRCDTRLLFLNDKSFGGIYPDTNHPTSDPLRGTYVPGYAPESVPESVPGSVPGSVPVSVPGYVRYPFLDQFRNPFRGTFRYLFRDPFPDQFRDPPPGQRPKTGTLMSAPAPRSRRDLTRPAPRVPTWRCRSARATSPCPAPP